TAMGVDLARQKYKPSWGLNATYGHRSSDPFGNSRPDNITVGVSLSVPLFTANRQDKEYSSAISIREAVRTEKWQLLRKLKAGFEASKAKLIRLDERKALFENKLLPQMNEQAEASLTAYTNDDGDFAEVVRARIAELNAKIDALNIDVDRQKTILELNYYFTTAETENVTTDAGYGEPK
ncbi:MAG TPA: TolC family protein, partial [Emcibacteraceae bacterium]|nr:TolC family protein [Emcibacteraceae bacterium]